MGFKPLSTRGESYETMRFEDKSEYYFQNQTTLRGLDQDRSAKDVKFWLNEAAKDGILFYRDGRAVAPVEVENEYEKLMEGYENITSGVFLSDLVLVSYDPHSDKQRFDYHPVIVSNGDIIVNWEKPLTEEELDQKYKEAEASQEQREVSFGNNPFATDVDPFGRPGMPQDESGHDPFVEDNIQQEKEDSFDPDYSPTGFDGKNFRRMPRAEREAYNKDVAAIIDDLAKPHATDDAEFHEILLNACKHGMIFYPNGIMVTEQTLEAMLERLSYEPNSNRAANALTDFIVVEYNPVTEDITDRKIYADGGSVYMDKDHPLEVEAVRDAKDSYEKKIAIQEAEIAEKAAVRIAFQKAVEEVDVPGVAENTASQEDEFDLLYGPDAFNGKDFDDMTDEEKTAYNKEVNEILDDFAEKRYASNPKFREALLKACQHGMLYFPNGKMATEEDVDDTFKRTRYETNPDYVINEFTDFVLVEYDPLDSTICHRMISTEGVSVYVDKEYSMTDKQMLRLKALYERKVARREAEIAKREARYSTSRKAVEQANAPVEQANAPVVQANAPVEQANAPVEESVAPVVENAAAVEENVAKPFSFTRPVTVENEVGPTGRMSDKLFDAMNNDEKLQFFYRNETILRGLDDSKNAADVSLWLKDAANRGILFYRDGRAVESDDVNNEVAKLSGRNGAIASGSFLSDLVVANYAPKNNSLGFHPISVANGKVIADSEHPLSREGLEQKYAGILLELGPNGFNGKTFAEMNDNDKQEYTDKVNEVLGFLEKKDQRLDHDFHAKLQAAAALGMLSDPYGHMVAVDEVEKFSKSPGTMKDLIVTITDSNGKSKESYALDVNTQGLTPTVTLDRGLHRLTEEKALEPMRAGMLNRLSPKELVAELAVGILDLDTAKRTAVTNALTELGCYRDLSYTTQDGVKHEKGYANVNGEIYLRGNTTPSTPDELVRYAEGVQPPKKPTGFFSGVREWWHKNISKLDDFTKYETQTKEYEITKYYTCVKAGLSVDKPRSVEQYEKEAAVDLYLDANFENLVVEWNELTVGSPHGPLNNKNMQAKIREQFKERLLNDNYLLRDFVKTPEVQKLLSERYGANFKLFGENGRKAPAFRENEKAMLGAVGSEIVHRNQWNILSKFAATDLDKDVYTVMGRVADCYDPAKNNLAFMKDLETSLRKNTPMADHIRNKLLKCTPDQLLNFYNSCTNYHKNDAPYSIEMTAADEGLLTDTMAKDLLDEKCANWLKPLDDLTASSTAEEKDFFNDLKAAFTKYPHIAKAAAREFGPLDENFIKKMAPAVEQYTQVKGFKGIKDLGALGVLEVIAHNGLFNPYSSQEVKDDIKKQVNPAFERKALWRSVKVENWTQDFNKFSQNQKTQPFIADFRAAVISHSDIGEKIMNEHETIDQDFVNKLTSSANDYSKSGKPGELGTLAAAGKTGLFKEETVKAIDEACKKADPNYVSPFANAKKPSEMSEEERKANAQKGTEHILAQEAQKAGGNEYVPINQGDSEEMEIAEIDNANNKEIENPQANI